MIDNCFITRSVTMTLMTTTMTIMMMMLMLILQSKNADTSMYQVKLL